MDQLRFHVSYLVDPHFFREREAFIRRSPEEVRLYLTVHADMGFLCKYQYPSDPNSCLFMYSRSKRVGLHLVRRANTFISRQIGVTVAEFQSFINPDITKEKAVNSYFDSELKALYQHEFEARCPVNERCIRPSHLMLFRNGFPYDPNPDPTPLSIPQVIHLQKYAPSGSEETQLKYWKQKISGAIERIPHRVARLSREIEIFKDSRPNAHYVASCREKVRRLNLYEIALQNWLDLYDRYQLEPTYDLLVQLLKDPPQSKRYLRD